MHTHTQSSATQTHHCFVRWFGAAVTVFVALLRQCTVCLCGAVTKGETYGGKLAHAPGSEGGPGGGRAETGCKQPQTPHYRLDDYPGTRAHCTPHHTQHCSRQTFTDGGGTGRTHPAHAERLLHTQRRRGGGACWGRRGRPPAAVTPAPAPHTPADGRLTVVRGRLRHLQPHDGRVGKDKQLRRKSPPKFT